MVRFRKVVATDDSIIRGLILDSRDLFSRERYEQRIEYELAVFAEQFHKNKTVDKKEVRKAVGRFIRNVASILKELEDMKRRAEQEETRKIEGIRLLLSQGARINSKELGEKLEKFGESIKSNTFSVLRSQRRRERRLRRGKAPIGFVLKKLRQDRYLDAEVARKAARIGEDIQSEHELSSEIELLIGGVKGLNTPPNEMQLEQLTDRINRLIKDYEEDLENFLNIEIDIEIEEARKLHRIDHYITFLKMIKSVGNFDDLIQELKQLRERAEVWVSQDSIDARKLGRYAKMSLNYGMRLLEESKAAKGKEFQGIITSKFHSLTGVPGILIYKEGMIDRMGMVHTNRGIVLVHGITVDKENLLILGKRLATQNYIVYTIDTTSHGENTEKFRLGRNSELIHEAVGWLRHIGVMDVGVIGHSAGAVSTLFALSGYNAAVENEFYGQVERVMKISDELAVEINNKIKSKEDTGEVLKDKTIREKLYEFDNEYTKLKKIILDGLKNMFAGRSRINAAVLLAAPITFQFVFPKTATQFLKKRGKKTIQRIGWVYTHIVGSGGERLFSLLRITPRSPVYKSIAQKDEAQYLNLIIPLSDFYDFLDYIENIKNPYDFINWINFLCEKKRRPDKSTQFFIYYRNFIRKTPKLFIYGLGDQLLRPLKKNNMQELEEHYKNFGETDIVRYPNVGHQLNKEGKDWEHLSGKLPRMTYKMVMFLNRYLGRGRLV